MEAFVDLTMRQVSGLLHAMGKNKLIDYYKSISAYAVIQGVKIPSLDEFLGATSKDSAQNKSSFDEKTDKLLEQYALNRIKEKKDGK